MESYIYAPLIKNFKEKRNNKTTMTNHFPTEYQHYIYKSRYARWNNELNRREDWPETVSRYMEFMKKHLFKNHNYTIDENVYNETYNAILNLEVLPSMRLLMAAGPAVERDNVAGYNCSYLPINAYGDSIKVEHEHLEEPITINIKHPVDFDEAMYILMCGTGVGFSVERQEISNLPTVGNKLSRKMYAANNKNFPNVPKDEISTFDKKTNTVHVHDSKYGWSSGFRILLVELFNGNFDVKWDLSQLRPAGSPLKTFGGFSSGPEPLDRLFRHCADIFKKATGRKLTSLECHDIMCLVGNCIVVGGFRRSALISLSNLSDDRMRHAKSGNWYNVAPHRALANNSAVYDGKPDLETFLREWTALIESKSGERGIINRKAFRDKCDSIGRKSYQTFGTNPCSLHEDTLIFTSTGPKKIKDLLNKPFISFVNGKPYMARRGSWISGKKELFKLTTKEGFTLTLTDDHRLMTESGWKEVKDLKENEKLVLCEHNDMYWEGAGNESSGYILGLFVGDGNFAKGTSENSTYFGQIKIWQNKEGNYDGLDEEVLKHIDCYSNSRRKDWKPFVYHIRQKYLMSNIGDLPQQYGLSPDNKHDISVLEETGSAFQKGFIRGLFDSDGHIEGNLEKGFSIRLSQSNYQLLQSVQRMLLKFGIYSVIYNGHKEKLTLLPDGKGGKKYYKTNANYRLCISGKSVIDFCNRIGFKHNAKLEKCKEVYKVEPYVKKFTATFTKTESIGIHDVWDAEVEDIVSFDANGFHAHNSEIILRPFQFCNLSTIVARENDTAETLKKKARIATLLGTWQSTLTNFRYLRSIWKENCDEERLLGVSITGIMDCKALSDMSNEDGLKDLLSSIRVHVRRINKEEAARIGINKSAAITCVKPEGCRTSDSLVTTSTGIYLLEDFFTNNELEKNTNHADYGKIVSKYNNGVSPVLKVSCTFGLELESTPNHKWMVHKKGWVRTDSLKEGDQLILNLESYKKQENATLLKNIVDDELHYNCKSDVTFPDTLSPDFCWLLGYILGDGAMCEDKSRFRFIDGNKKAIRKAARIFKELFNLNGAIRQHEVKKAEMLEIASRKLWAYFEVNGLIKDHNKIPLKVRESSVEDIAAFYAGWLDSDGHANKSVIFTTANDALANHMQQVALSIGLVIGKSKNIKRKGSFSKKHIWLMCLSVGQCTDTKHLLKKHSVKLTNFNMDKGFSRSKVYKIGVVKNITPVGVKETYDVETEQHWFWAGSVMSHNTVSQLTNTSSGIHARYAPYYIRRVRGENYHPLTKFLKSVGVPNEPDVISPDTTTVFSFLQKAPESSIKENELTSSKTLRFWRLYRDYWCDHNPSTTVHVKDNEWLEVGDWVYKNFDSIGGLAFLPYSNHTYMQAPYEKITEEQYNTLVEKMPIIDWNRLQEFEVEDNTTSSQEFACTGNVCEIVDIGKK